MNRIILIVILISLMASPLLASNLAITGYYPVPENTYQRFRLVPIDEQTDNPCIIGTLYNNKDQGNSLFYCRDVGTTTPLGKWGALSGAWVENNETSVPLIILADQASPEAKKVGIGTDTPEFKLTLENNSGIFARGAFNDSSAANYNILSEGAYFIWWPKKSALRAGTVTYQSINASTKTSWDPDLVGNYSVAFGNNTLASAIGSVVASGENNRTGESSSCGPYSTIVGGKSNQINFGKQALAIGGGESHHLGGDVAAGLNCSATGASYEFIGGGKGYMLGKNSTTVIGGEGGAYPSAVTELGLFSSIGGGLIPAQSYDTITYLTALGGSGHTLNSEYGVLGGGQGNSLSGRYGFIGGGQSNAVSGDYAVIGGGSKNTAATYATVLGGGEESASYAGNSATGAYSTILGGRQITCDGDHAACGGGAVNQSHAAFSSIGGGSQNTIDSAASDSAIAFGNSNSITGQSSFLGGGTQNTISGNFSVIPGNTKITVSGDHSLGIGGTSLTVASDNTFAFASTATVTINSSDSFIIYATTSLPASLNAKVGIGTSTPTERLHVRDGNIRVDGTLTISNPSTIATAKSPLLRSIDGTLGYDLAERFPTSETVEAGDIVIIDTDSDTITLRRSSQPYDKRAIGVASLAPAMILSGEHFEMNAGGQPSENDSIPVALSGRVLCKVSLENGPISYGDLITTSSLAGHAMRADRDKSFGTVIGKALESFPETAETENATDTGVILIMITLQ